MQGMMITTPEGHQCRLSVNMTDRETAVTVEYGSLSVTKRSDQKGDIGLIDEAMEAMDNMMTNLQGSNPRIEEIPWW